MKRSFRGVSTFLGGAVFVALACFVAPNCQPTGGDMGSGGSGDGGSSQSGSGGKSGNGGAGGGSNGGATSAGGSANGGTTSNGGNQGTGGKSSNGGSGGSSNGGTTTSNGGSSAGGTTTSNGGTVSNGGTTTSNGGTVSNGGTTTVSNGGTTGASTAAGKCAPTTTTFKAPATTGGLACPGGLCTVGTYAGYTYTYADAGGSTICVAADSLCASGNTAIADAKGTIWGAGVGFNLDKSTTPLDVQLSGTGVTYALSAMPTQGMRVQVNVGTQDYCAKLTAASGTVLWTDFNTACWDNSGTKLTAAPKTQHIGFQVTAAATAGTFDFCVKSVSF